MLNNCKKILCALFTDAAKTARTARQSKRKWTYGNKILQKRMETEWNGIGTKCVRRELRRRQRCL